MNERQKESLAFLQNQEEWPHVILPMVKRGQGWPEAAFMLPEGKPKLYKKNMWELSPDIHLEKQLENVPVIEFASFEELVNDGWEVD